MEDPPTSTVEAPAGTGTPSPDAQAAQPPEPHPQAVEAGERAAVPEEQHSSGIGLQRVVWLLTTVAFLIAVLILLLRGDLGYAGVTLAVALAAAINLF